MSTTSAIARLEDELAAAKQRILEDTALLAGLHAQISVLKSSADNAGDIGGLPATDAIVAVLRRSQQAMGPSDILQAFTAAGRSEDLRSISATLSYLRTKGAVSRVARAQYVTAT